MRNEVVRFTEKFQEKKKNRERRERVEVESEVRDKIRED